MEELDMKCPRVFFPDHSQNCKCVECNSVRTFWEKKIGVCGENALVVNPTSFESVRKGKRRKSKWMMLPNGRLLHKLIYSYEESYSTPDIVWTKEHLQTEGEIRNFCRIAWGILLRDTDPLFVYGVHNFVTHVCQDYRMSRSRS